MSQLIKDILGIKSKEQKKSSKEESFQLPYKELGDITLGSDGKYKLIGKVTPVNGELLDEHSLEAVSDAIQGALNSYEGRVQITIQSERVDIKSNLNHMEQRKQELTLEDKIIILEESKKHLASMANKSRNVLNFYITIEEKEKDYSTAEDLLADAFSSIKNELEAEEMEFEQLKKSDVGALLYGRTNPEVSIVEPYREGVTNILPENATRFADGRHIQIENRLYRFFSITKYPSEVDKYRWLRKIFSVKGDINVSITLTPKNKATIQKELNNAVRELGGRKNLSQNDEVKKQEYEDEIESAKNMIRELGSDNVSLYDTNITIGISASSMKELDTLASSLRSKISSTYCQATELKNKGYDPFYTTLPLLVENKITKNYVWNLSTKDVASIIPFDSSEFMESKGSLIAENVTSKGLVIVDSNNKIYNNGHMCVIADSGSGKTFFLMTDAMRNYPYYDYTIMFDIKGDLIFPFGTRITFSPTSGYITNPFHISNAVIDSESDANNGKVDVGNYLAQKIMDVIVHFKWIIPNMSPYDEALLEEDIRDAYSKCELTFDSKELPELFPTYSTLDEIMIDKIKKADTEMERERRNYIKACLKPFISGAYSKMFNGQTNWKIDTFTVFDISNVHEAVQKPLYDTLFKEVWQFAKKDGTKRPTKKRIYVDECHVLADIKNPQSLEFISAKLSKQSRGFGVKFITATQNLPDFLSIPKYGQAIIDNSYFKIFFRLGESDLPVAQKLYRFSEAEMRILRASKSKKKGSKGKGIFIAGAQRVVIQTIASKFELEIIDPEQYEEIYGIQSRFINGKRLTEVM